MEPEVKNNVAKPDPKQIAELQEKFDSIRTIIETKKYGVDLTVEQATFLMDEFYNQVEWKGYECYAIAETYSSFKALHNSDGIHGAVPAEIIEAVFHFLKAYISKGFKFAGLFKEVCDQFAIPMQEINQDRQELRDASLEVTAAEQGISVENLVEKFSAAQAQQ